MFGIPAIALAVDVHSRLPTALALAYRSPGDIVGEMDRACRKFGYPKEIQLDHSIELTCKALEKWGAQNNVAIVFRPLGPWSKVARSILDVLHTAPAASVSIAIRATASSRQSGAVITLTATRRRQTQTPFKPPITTLEHRGRAAWADVWKLLANIWKPRREFEMKFHNPPFMPKAPARQVMRPVEAWATDFMVLNFADRPFVMMVVDVSTRCPLSATVGLVVVEDIVAVLERLARRLGRPQQVWMDHSLTDNSAFGVLHPSLQAWAERHHISMTPPCSRQGVSRSARYGPSATSSAASTSRTY